MEQRRGIEMVPVGRYDPKLGLAADEYRFLADLLLDHIAAGEVWNGHLEQLVDRLFVLAVWAEGPPSRPAEVTPPEVRSQVAPLDV